MAVNFQIKQHLKNRELISRKYKTLKTEKVSPPIIVIGLRVQEQPSYLIFCLKIRNFAVLFLGNAESFYRLSRTALIKRR